MDISTSSRVERHGRWIASMAAILVTVAGLAFGARTAGGADSLGYVSQTYLWLEGDLHIPAPISAQLPWPHARESLAPLGYRPGGGNTNVPTYSPGLPLLMAAAYLLAGHCAPYWLPPLFGGLLVWCTFVLADRLTGNRLCAVVAAVLMASCPAMLFNITNPMSDTVTASLWTASFAALAGRRLRHAALGGGLAALAILVRPNLVPAAAATLLAAELWRDPQHVRLLRRSAAALATIVPAALFIGAVNYRLYGSPLLSGYGPSASLYSIDYLLINLRLYSTWLVTSEGLVLWPLLFLLVFGHEVLRRTQLAWMPLVVFAGIMVLSYLFYLPFDVWWYLRFLLPGFPVLFIVVGCGVAAVFTSARGGLLSGIVAAGLVAGVTVRLWPMGEHFQSARPGEERYAAVAKYVVDALPPNAVLLSMQHSQSLRYYAGRLILRYDAFSPTRLPSLLDWLQAHGYRPYIVLDEWEEERFKERFGVSGEAGRLNVHVVGEWSAAGVVRVFDPLTPSSGGGVRPFRIVPRRVKGCTGPHPNWRSTALRLPEGGG